VHNKKPAGGCRRARVSDLSGRLVQAMAVRRHGGPVMMVVTGMAEDLHLFLGYGKGQYAVKRFFPAIIGLPADLRCPSTHGAIPPPADRGDSEPRIAPQLR
jgi:hypothetical protein